MKSRASLAVATLLITLLGACAKRNDTPEAVKEGIIRDISKKLDVASMDVNVDSVSFRDKEADATVSFTAKGGSRSNAMVMKYVMERHDDNQWYIKSREVVGLGGGGSGSGALPAGHPATDGATGTAPATDLPAGHPEVGRPK